MQFSRLNRIKLLFLFYQVVCIAVLIIACQSTTPTLTTQTPHKNCVQDYNSNTDYFPQKANIKYATGFSVEYQNNYKVVTVNNPWKDASTSFKYVLVECGTPAPEDFKETKIITIPINTVASLSTTHLPHLAKLGVVDKLVGVSNPKIVNTPEVIEKIEASEIAELGNNVNVERLLETESRFSHYLWNGKSTNR